jgi:glycerophosphoryl diester phosphodiesterase
MAAKPEIIAHRGASHAAPENTLASYNLGWEMGADAVELDVHLSSDGRLVCMHDDDTGRTAGKPGPISGQTLAELRELDAGVWRGPEWAGQKIPTLEEALATVPDGKRLFIEIKGGPEVVSELGKVMQASGKTPRQIVIISFSLAAVKEAKEKLPRYEASWLSGFDQDPVSGAWSPGVETLVDNATNAGIDGLDLYAVDAIDQCFVQHVRAAGLKLYVWTVDDLDEAKQMQSAGVDGITTNQPDLMLKNLT